MSFDALGLSKSLIHAVEKQGYSQPTAIQEKAIPTILQGKDVLASAQTGTGKTAGFVLPILQLLGERSQPKNRPVRALILTPTRELAAQVEQSVVDYGAFEHLSSTVIFGGVKQNPQVQQLRRGVDIVIATPGRLLDLVNQGLLNLSRVEILVLDEADRMLDMGFVRDIKKIIQLLPQKRQNLLFSATFSKDIKALAATFLHQPVRIEATPENTTVEKIEQFVYAVDKSRKADLVVHLIKEGDWQQVLIFTRTKHGANRLSEKLEKSGIRSAAIHGNKSQGARTKALAGFKAGQIRVLVATDIAARGLDIPLLPHVINFELPNVAEDYVHRIGRTGRAGATGQAIALVTADEKPLVHAIEKLVDEPLIFDVVAGFEPKEGPSQKTSSKRPQQKPRPKNTRSREPRRRR